MPTTFNARISSKHDTEERWNLVADTFTPLSGEVIVYHDAHVPFDNQGNIVLNGRGVKIKIGDGIKTLSQLDFVYVGLESAVLSHVQNSEIHLSELDRQRLSKVDDCLTGHMEYITTTGGKDTYKLILEE